MKPGGPALAQIFREKTVKGSDILRFQLRQRRSWGAVSCLLFPSSLPPPLIHVHPRQTLITHCKSIRPMETGGEAGPCALQGSEG